MLKITQRRSIGTSKNHRAHWTSELQREDPLLLGRLFSPNSLLRRVLTLLKKNGARASRPPGSVLASARIYLSSNMCLHLSPQWCQIAGPHTRQWAHYLSPSMCLHLSPRAARSLGRMLASVRIYLSPSMPSFVSYLSPSMCLHLSPSAARIAGPHARQCVHLLVSQYVPSFLSQCCQIAGPHHQSAHPACAVICLSGPHACQSAHLLVSQYVPHLSPSAAR